ncbi:MAG TPA: 30S ribosomal protein S16 [Bacteroidales bacterium]|nr:30S ribosomal protein S16 [Bacteroidales bacterium]HRZ48368.1 30S ribosomal protein S16 [Bacteroidales bacterium]
MPTKIRLQRRGKKGQPFYHIIIADGRAPRDGKFIEKIGSYNPLTKPATIEIDFDKALQWLQNGAQPTDTARAILSYKGVMHKNHLLKGVQKGAMTPEQAEEKFQTWLKTKEETILQKVKQEELDKKNKKKKALESEIKVNEAIAARVAEKRAAKIMAETAPAPAEEAPAEPQEAADAPAEEPAE